MKISVLGLNHKSAPIDIREKLAFDSNQVLEALGQLNRSFPEAEFAILSTCNRVELYWADKRTGGVDTEHMIQFLADFHDISPGDFKDFLYAYQDENAARHLLMVASSLDSMVVGEAQIIKQVKESYHFACVAKSTDKILNRLFHCAFYTSKKIYTTTAISSGRVSVAGVAVELAMQLFADISSAKVVVIGAGEMGELLVQHLLQIGCHNITIINRSYERGKNIAEQYGVSAEKWEELNERLMDVDIVIASAAVQDYLFRKSPFKEIMDGRHKRPVLIIDIAVPRNFEPTINQLGNVYLYSVDELSEVAEQNRRAREEDITKGMAIVYEKAADFMDWFRARDIGPLIGQMKKKFTQISQDEIERFFVGKRKDAYCKDIMIPMVSRIVNKLLHCVIKNVDTVAKKHGSSEAAKFVDGIVQHAEQIRCELNDKEDSCQRIKPRRESKF